MTDQKKEKAAPRSTTSSERTPQPIEEEMAKPKKILKEKQPAKDKPPQSSAAANTRKIEGARFAAKVIAPAGTEADRVQLINRPMDVHQGRPKSRRFVQFHPTLEAPVYTFEDPNADDEDDLPTTYLVGHDLLDEVGADVRRATVYVYTYRGARPRPSLWIIPDPISGNTKSEEWHDAKLEIIEIARAEWTRIARSPDRKVSGYEPIHPLTARYGVPDWDRILGGRDVGELLHLAFGRDVIDSMDHPALKDFYGLA
jgi:hypothetical protein